MSYTRYTKPSYIRNHLIKRFPFIAYLFKHAESPYFSARLTYTFLFCYITPFYETILLNLMYQEGPHYCFQHLSNMCYAYNLTCVKPSLLFKFKIHIATKDIKYGKCPKLCTSKLAIKWHVQTVQTQIRLFLRSSLIRVHTICNSIKYLRNTYIKSIF